METNRPSPEDASLRLIRGDPDKEIKEHLAKFLLPLIQAFLRTGYYTPDHPQSKTAKEGLYENFQTLLNNEFEFTFLACDVPGGKKIFVEGMFLDSQELSSIMPTGMAEMYTPKFATFLERKDLVSVTLKAAMTSAEFNNFIDLMGEPTFSDTLERSDKERFVEALKERGIFNISYIFNEELLAGERDIPWRSQVALSRLRKDFKMVPFYQNLDAESMKKVRRQIIRDVVRPVQTAEVIYPILLHSDLAVTEEFKESEINEEMILCLSDELLLQVSRTLLAETQRRPAGDSHYEKPKRLAKQIAAALKLREIKGGDKILEEYYENQLIPIEVLPETIQRRIKMKRELDKFIQHADEYLKMFDQIEDAQKYIRFAGSLINILPELIRRDRYEEVLKIIARIERHSMEKGPLSSHAGQILNEIGKGKILEALKSKLMTGHKEICQAIAPIFIKLGKSAVTYLLPLLEESDDQVVHKTACEILMRIDPSNINLILSELDKEGFGTASTVRIIRALGDTEGDEWIQTLTEALQSYFNHENPRFREEALWSYYRVMGAKGEKMYLALFRDADIAVQKKAIQCLGRMKSEVAFERFLEILKDLGNDPSGKSQQIIPTLFGALAFYGNVERPGEGSLEDFLLEALERQVSLGPLKFLKKKKEVLSEGAVAAVVETLGKIGTKKSRSILEKLEKQDNIMWKSKATEALKTIDDRASIS